MVRIPKEDFLGYDATFASCGGEDWLLLDSIFSVFLHKSLLIRSFAERYLPDNTSFQVKTHGELDAYD